MTMDTETIITITQIRDLLGSIYSAQLFCIGVITAVSVCILLYKFLKLFY